MDPLDAGQRLVPLLRADLAPSRRELESWSARLAAESRELLSILLPFGAGETEFLERVNEYGEIVPDRLSDDPLLQQCIRSHPALLWKTLSVRRHLGLEKPGRDATDRSEGG